MNFETGFARVATHCLCAMVFTVFFTRDASAADVFDRHTLVELKLASKDAVPLSDLAAAVAAKWKTISPKVSSPCIVVRTNEGHWAKALLAWGQRKVKGRDQPVSVLLLERFVTYHSEREGQTTATGKDVMLSAGLSFSFELGQVVPTGTGADIEFTDTGLLKPVGDAKLFALNGSQLAAADAAKPNPADHEGVLPRDFTGTWKVSIDGRWTGTWEIAVDDQRTVLGKFTSADTQSSYDLFGKVSNVSHQAKLGIDLANAQLEIDAFLWTTDKSTMAGTVVMANRKFGFVAARQE